MKIETKWSKNSDGWFLSSEIDIDDGIILYLYLASIEFMFCDISSEKKVYVITDFFGEYHPNPGQHFGEGFKKLKDAKAWAEKEAAKGLSKIVKQVKELGK